MGVFEFKELERCRFSAEEERVGSAAEGWLLEEDEDFFDDFSLEESLVLVLEEDEDAVFLVLSLLEDPVPLLLLDCFCSPLVPFCFSFFFFFFFFFVFLPFLCFPMSLASSEPSESEPTPSPVSSGRKSASLYSSSSSCIMVMTRV